MPDMFDQGYLALPSTEQPAPAVMVIHAWWGLNSFFKQLCDRLAEAGFVAFAPDLYDGAVAQTIAQAETLGDGLDRDIADARLREAVAAFRQHPRANGQPIGVIGFSLGAFLAMPLLKTISDDIAALVVFYGMRGGQYPAIKTAVLGHFAEEDEFESRDDQDEVERLLKAAGIETTFHTYPGTEHWFFESNQPKAYNADAAELAWERTLEFLKAHL